MPHRSRHILSTNKGDFDQRNFLANVGEGQQVVSFAKTQTIFLQGDAADSVCYILEGNIRLTVAGADEGRIARMTVLFVRRRSHNLSRWYLGSTTPCKDSTSLCNEPGGAR